MDSVLEYVNMVQRDHQPQADTLHDRLLAGPEPEALPDVLPLRQPLQRLLLGASERGRQPGVCQLGLDPFDVDADLMPVRDSDQREVARVGQVEAEPAGIGCRDVRLALRAGAERNTGRGTPQVARQQQPQMSSGGSGARGVKRADEPLRTLPLVGTQDGAQRLELVPVDVEPDLPDVHISGIRRCERRAHPTSSASSCCSAARTDSATVAASTATLGCKTIVVWPPGT